MNFIIKIMYQTFNKTCQILKSVYYPYKHCKHTIIFTTIQQSSLHKYAETLMLYNTDLLSQSIIQWKHNSNLKLIMNYQNQLRGRMEH